MNHYCTYFDRGFLIQGLALWRSLAAHDVDAVIWMLALDDFTADVLRETGGTWMRVVTLAELEADDPALAAAKANRSRVEYYFTLSPCWPHWLLGRHPEIERVTYLDADMLFFEAPAPIFAAMDAAGASVLITPHRFPAPLREHYERHGRYNVGILSFRNDAAGRSVLEDWRTRCLEWCHDRLEAGRYADQKYLDAWPERFGAAVLVLENPGVNFAPWNWMSSRWSALSPTRLIGTSSSPNQRVGLARRGGDNALQLSINGQPLVLFHFARFRPICGDWWWQSGQLDYGVMPGRLRNALYGPYWRARAAARAEIAARRPGFDFVRRPARLGREFRRTLPLRILFGSDWCRLGDRFISGRLGLGRYSGQCLARLRRIFFRR
jgi:hypothetical protein